MKKLIARLVLEYFRLTARLQLKKNSQAIIIGITGTAGKTSCRLALATILQARGKTKHSISANSESGIPLNILGLTPHDYSHWDWLRLIMMVPVQLLINWQKYDYYIVEMGIDSPEEPKNMGYLLKIVQPDIAIVLNIGLAHAAAFDHLVKDRGPERRQSKIRELIAAEKMRLARTIRESGVAILNGDQKEIMQYTKKIRARILTVGKRTAASFRLTKVGVNSKGFHMKFTHQNQSYEFNTSDIYTPVTAHTLLSAIAAARVIGIPVKDSIETLSGYHSPPGRLRLFHGIKDTTLIDSSYNAAPDTMKNALTLFKDIAPRKSKKVAIIGDMLELGQSTKSSHKELAKQIEKNADEAILFGEAVEKYTLPILLQANFPVHHFTSMAKLIQYAEDKIPPHSWILVKGSQNKILLERVVESLLDNPEDRSRLARRGVYWDKIRSLS